jgi:hypothetical protein
LIPTVSSPSVRSHAEATLEHLKNFSKEAASATALAAMKQTGLLRNTEQTQVASLSRRMAEAGSSPGREGAK